MTVSPIDKARADAAKATAKLEELEAKEAALQAEEEAKRQAAEREAAERFLADLPELERKAKGESPDASAKAEAMEAGKLGSLLCEFLSRRDVVSTLRDHADYCARVLGREPLNLAEVRYIDPAEELKRWQEDAVNYARRTKAESLAEFLLKAYEVAV
ncbi:hypothetical protein DMH26_14380 [Streptomyces sp. WAC 05379]|uniref:hypothetical protein n=1 Tax=Streptomyces sp. WAC 05379 TaxID=2203207 RepID=UPI000F73B5BC|nr:hypothetical protein [Streptomyces sp. WAC 05379]RSO02328.1 hypothetical protein DMH26_14380 [Streptomyces sp. WAC 05379]